MAWQAALETSRLDPQHGSETILDANGGDTGPAHVTNTFIALELSGGGGPGTTTQRGFPVSG